MCSETDRWLCLPSCYSLLVTSTTVFSIPVLTSFLHGYSATLAAKLFIKPELSVRMLESNIDVCFDWLNRVSWRDPKSMVTAVVQETHSVMAQLLQSKTTVLKSVSYLLYNVYKNYDFMICA